MLGLSAYTLILHVLLTKFYHFQICDFGKVRDCIVPPNCIRLKYSRMKQHLYIKEVLKPNISCWSPVIVVGKLNPLSVLEKRAFAENIVYDCLL